MIFNIFGGLVKSLGVYRHSPLLLAVFLIIQLICIIVSCIFDNMYFKSVIQLDARNYMVFAVDSLGNDKCLYYHYDKNASTVPTKQITVYALEDSHVLQQTISYFQKKNPDVYVKKLIGLSGNNSVTADDAIKALNTDIMAGKGPDVLVTDGLPVERYIEKGILTDASKIFVMKGEKVHLVQGEVFNIKITYPYDLRVAESLIRNGEMDK